VSSAGITVRSRSIVGNSRRLPITVRRQITSTPTCASGQRSDTYRLIGEHASSRAQRVIAMHYDATELMAGLTEVLCYGTAVIVERERPGAYMNWSGPVNNSARQCRPQENSMPLVHTHHPRRQVQRIQVRGAQAVACALIAFGVPERTLPARPGLSADDFRFDTEP